MMKVLQRNMQSLFIVKNKRRKNGPRYLNPAGLPCCVLLVFDELMDDELTPWQPANTCHIHHVSKCISNLTKALTRKLFVHSVQKINV